MHTLINCLKCLKGFGYSRTTPENVIDDQLPRVDAEEIEIRFRNFHFEIPLETERNNSFMQEMIDEYEILSFSASSINCVSERCSSVSDMFEGRQSKGFSPEVRQISNQGLNSSIIRQSPINCLVLRPPENFSLYK